MITINCPNGFCKAQFSIDIKDALYNRYGRETECPTCHKKILLMRYINISHKGKERKSKKERRKERESRIA